MKLTNEYRNACRVTADGINKFAGRNVIMIDGDDVTIDPSYFNLDRAHYLFSEITSVFMAFYALLDFETFDAFTKSFES